MSYSVQETRKRLLIHYLALPLVAIVVLLYRRHELLANLDLWYLLPMWPLLAHPLSGFSYLVTSLSLKSGYVLVRTSVRVYGSLGSLVHLQAALLTALAEEVLFRYLLLFWLADLLDSGLASLVITSLLFSAAHLRLGLRLTSIPRYLDLFIFAMLLGGLTLWTGSLYPALLIHWVRNYILRCLLISREEYEELHGSKLTD